MKVDQINACIKQLGSSTGFQIFLCLARAGKMTVSLITEYLNQPQPLVSYYLLRMKSCGLLSSESEGVYKLYFVNKETVREVIAFLSNVIDKNADN